MNVTFKWMGKQTLCENCKKPVLLDDPVIVHGWRNKRGYTGRLFYHPECFVERYLFRLKMETPKPYRFGRGRKSLGLPPEQMKRRRTLLQKVRRGTIKPEEQTELEGMDATREIGVRPTATEQGVTQPGHGQEAGPHDDPCGTGGGMCDSITVGGNPFEYAYPARAIDG